MQKYIVLIALCAAASLHGMLRSARLLKPQALASVLQQKFSTTATLLKKKKDPRDDQSKWWQKGTFSKSFQEEMNRRDEEDRKQQEAHDKLQKQNEILKQQYQTAGHIRNSIVMSLFAQHEYQVMEDFITNNNELAFICLLPHVNNLNKDNGKETLLHKAVRLNRVDMVEMLLLRQDLDINAEAHELCDTLFHKHGTALHIAVLHDHGEIVRMLLNDNRIDTKRTCTYGEKECTALELAENLERMGILIIFDECKVKHYVKTLMI